MTSTELQTHSVPGPLSELNQGNFRNRAGVHERYLIIAQERTAQFDKERRPGKEIKRCPDPES
jgi:hypothetical protein